MAEELTWLPRLHLVHARIGEEITLGLLRRMAFQAHLQVRMGQPTEMGLLSLVDLRGAWVGPEQALVDHALGLQGRLGEHYPFQRRAIVARNPELLVLCRRFVELSEAAAIHSAVFDSLAAALVWLGLDPDLETTAPFNGQPVEDRPCS